jgi:hypothetical protein
VRGVDPVTERSVVVRGQPQVDLSLDLSFAKVARVPHEGGHNWIRARDFDSSCQAPQVVVCLQSALPRLLTAARTTARFDFSAIDA